MLLTLCARQTCTARRMASGKRAPHDLVFRSLLSNISAPEISCSQISCAGGLNFCSEQSRDFKVTYHRLQISNLYSSISNRKYFIAMHPKFESVSQLFLVWQRDLVVISDHHFALASKPSMDWMCQKTRMMKILKTGFHRRRPHPQIAAVKMKLPFRHLLLNASILPSILPVDGKWYSVAVMKDKILS